MSYDNEIVKICRAENGFTVEIIDMPTPQEAKKEEKEEAKSPCCGSSFPEWDEYVFATSKEALAFLAGKLDGLSRKDPGEEYDDAFNAGAAAGASTKKKKR